MYFFCILLIISDKSSCVISESPSRSSQISLPIRIKLPRDADEMVSRGEYSKRLLIRHVGRNHKVEEGLHFAVEVFEFIAFAVGV